MSPDAPGGRGLLLGIVSVVVAIAVVAGFLALGTPRSERGRRLDDARLEDLRAASARVSGHFARTGALPSSLAEADAALPGATPLADPETRAPYAYEVLGDSTFRLCATFDHPTEDDRARMAYDPWAHAAGRSCFRFRVGRGTATPDVPVALEPLPELAPEAPRR